MSQVLELRNKFEVLDNIDFIWKTMTAVTPDCKPEQRKQDFDCLLRHAGEEDFAIFLQMEGSKPIAMCSMVLLETLKGEKVCWIWLVHALPGADTKEAYELVIEPWAKARGADAIQAGNEVETRAKQRWFEGLGFKKAFEIYERVLK